jgi:hypothetical protein
MCETNNICRHASIVWAACDIAREIRLRCGSLRTAEDAAFAIAYTARRLGGQDVAERDLHRVTRVVQWYAGDFPENVVGECLPGVVVALYVLDLLSGDIFSWIREGGDEHAWEDAWNIAVGLQPPGPQEYSA